MAGSWSAPSPPWLSLEPPAAASIFKHSASCAARSSVVSLVSRPAGVVGHDQKMLHFASFLLETIEIAAVVVVVVVVVMTRIDRRKTHAPQ